MSERTCVKCRQCGLKFPGVPPKGNKGVFTDRLALNNLRNDWNHPGSHGVQELPFCGPMCALAFLENAVNHAELFWVQKEYTVPMSEDDCMCCDLDESEARLPGPFLAVGGPYGSIFDEVCASTYFCSIECLKEGLRAEQKSLESVGWTAPWYADVT